MNGQYLDIYLVGCVANGYSPAALKDRFSGFNLRRIYDSIQCDLINGDEEKNTNNPKVLRCSCFAIYKKSNLPDEAPITVSFEGPLDGDVAGRCRMRIHKTQFEMLGINDMPLEELVMRLKDPKKRAKLHSLFWSLGDYNTEIKHVIDSKK